MWKVDLNELRQNSSKNSFSKMEDAAKKKYNDFIKCIQKGKSPREAAQTIGSSHGSNLERLGNNLMSIRLSQEHRVTFYIRESTSTVVINSVGTHYKNA
ncbi:hypothetical protein CIG19_13915 [Enterobacterales bacterium CwR94]|nr:hypothetical protein CIG19_13915 [Enterobacterales bacterium CwR94]